MTGIDNQRIEIASKMFSAGTDSWVGKLGLD